MRYNSKEIVLCNFPNRFENVITTFFTEERSAMRDYNQILYFNRGLETGNYKCNF